MGILNWLKNKNNDNNKLILSMEDKHFLDTIAVGMWIGNAPKPKDINDLTCRELKGKVSYCIPAKKYELAEKLLNLAENKAENEVDLHYCYNDWIELTYKQRENPSYLNLCIEYCKKDIELYPKIDKEMSEPFESKRIVSNSLASKKRREEVDSLREQQIKDGVDFRAYIPSFERLAIIYEKQKDFRSAIAICELAIEYNLKPSTKEGYAGRLEKLKAKLTKLS